VQRARPRARAARSQSGAAGTGVTRAAGPLLHRHGPKVSVGGRQTDAAGGLRGDTPSLVRLRVPAQVGAPSSGAGRAPCIAARWCFPPPSRRTGSTSARCRGDFGGGGCTAIARGVAAGGWKMVSDPDHRARLADGQRVASTWRHPRSRRAPTDRFLGATPTPPLGHACPAPGGDGPPATSRPCPGTKARRTWPSDQLARCIVR
jgi:hypothetical protein